MGARVATSHRQYQRGAGALLAALIVAGSAIAPIAPAAALPSDRSEALASVLGSDLLAIQLADEGTAAAGYPSAAGPDTADIDAAVLAGLVGVNLPALTIPVISNGVNGGILDLGPAAGAGVLNAYSGADSVSHAVASAGAVGADGAVNLAAVTNPSTIGQTRVDVTALIGQLGLGPATTTIVDQLSVELGALASRAEQTAPATATREYYLAGGRLNLHSPALAGLAGTLTTTVNGTQGLLNSALGTALAGVNLDVNLGLAALDVTAVTPTVTVDVAPVLAALTATDLVSSDGLVTLNLGTGSVRVDLAKLLKGPGGTDLNGLPANTQVLTATTISAIVAGVANILNSLDETATTLLTTAVNAATVTLSLAATVAVPVPFLPPITTGATITIAGTLAQLIGNTAAINIALDLPIIDGNLLLAPVRALVGSVIGTALSPVVPLVVAPLGSAVATVAGTVLTAIDPVLRGVLAAILQLTINQQSAGDLGATSSTVRALAVDVAPGLGTLAAIRLASSTVRAEGAAPPITPLLTAGPDPVQAGATVNVSSTGWVPGSSVTVVARDSANAPVGAAHVITADGAGALIDTIPLPTTTPLGTLTVTGTSPDGTASDTVQVTAATPPPVLTIGPPTVSVGDTVAVSTSGWPAGASVTIVYRDAGNTVIGTHPLTADGTGALTDSLVVAPGTPLGPLTATASGPGPVAPSGTVTVVAPPAVPAIDATPTSLRAGDALTIAGTGWPPNATVDLLFTDAGGATFTATATTDGTGAFSTVVTVPVGTDAGTLGIAASSGAAGATDQVQVSPDPAVAARDDDRYPGETVTVDGSGWAPGAVTVTYTDADGTELGSHTVTADGTGAFTDSLPLPAGTAVGTLVISAVQVADTATDTVEVLTAPTLVAAPPVVAPGGSVTASGTDWPAAATVQFVWRDSAGTVVATTTRTADGAGVVSDTLVVPPTTPLGPLTVVATEVGGGTASAIVAVELPPVLIASPPSVLPGGTVTVVSSGWPAGASVDVTYTDVNGAQVGAVNSQVANGSGAFGDSQVVPVGTDPGTLTITAVGPGGRTASDTATVRPTPTLDASPASVLGGGTVAVDSDGWLPGSSVEVVYTDADGTVLATHTVVADGTGSFTDTYPVPVGTDPGTLTVTATDADGTTIADTVVVEAPPVLTAAPSTVSAGQTITVTSAGWPPNSTFDVEYRDADGDLIGAPHPVTTDASGEFDDTLLVPGGTVAGAIAITADDGAGRTATATVTVVIDPTLDATPASVQNGDRAEVAGTGWPASTAVTVEWTDADGNVLATNTVTTTADGELTDALDPIAAALGTLTVRATAGAIVRTDTIQVADGPAVAIAQSTVVPGAVIDVAGSGWTPSSTVALVYRGSDGVQIGATKIVSTDTSGALTDTLTVPLATPAGLLTVTATQGGDTASDAVTVVRTPTITSGPASVQPGDPVTTTGIGWPPNTTVTIEYTDGDGTVTTQTVVTDGDGDFTDTFVVPPGAPAGPLTVDATEPGGGTATDAVTVAIGPSVAADRENGISDAIINADGSGWTPGVPVTLVVTDATGDVLATQTVIPDADGTFASVWDLPGHVDPGELTITATSGPDIASDVVVIEERRLMPQDTLLAPGDTLPVDSDGWPEAVPVTFVFVDAAGTEVARTVEYHDELGWNSHSVVLPRSTALGALRITASDPYGQTLSATVTVQAAAAGVVPTGTGTSGRLASTGADAFGALASAVGLVLIGLLGMLAARRVRRRPTPERF